MSVKGRKHRNQLKYDEGIVNYTQQKIQERINDNKKIISSIKNKEKKQFLYNITRNN